MECFLWLLGKKMEPDPMKLMKDWGYNFYLEIPRINIVNASPDARYGEISEHWNIWPEWVVGNWTSFSWM